jgi:hypothetical protein
MLKRISILATLIVLLASCNDDSDENRGSLLITVFLQGSSSAIGAGVTVVTFPATKEVVTDQFGQAEFQNIGYGTYEVYAFIPNVGSGRTIVDVNEAVVKTDMDLVQGVFIQPFVAITSPADGTGFSENEIVSFKGLVGDNTTEVEDLNVMWSSSEDGDLGKGTINAEGIVSLAVEDLSKGIHTIRLTVENQLGITSKDSIVINTLSPKTPVLTAEPVSTGIKLSWTADVGSDFQKFELYRKSSGYGNSELIATLVSSSTQTYTDSNIPFADSVYYSVRAYNSAGFYSQSEQVGLKGNKLFNYDVIQAEISPNSDHIYLRTSDHHIVVFDYIKKEVVRDQAFDTSIGYFSIGSNGFGEELYIPRSDGWLDIYSMSSFELNGRISVGIPVECAISDNAGVIYLSVKPSPWWEQPLRSYSRDGLSFLGGTGDFDDCRLRLLPDGNSIIEITTTIGPTDMDYYNFSAGVPVSHSDDLYHGDHPLSPDIFRVSPAQGYLITASEGSVYSAAADMTYKGSLLRGNDTFSDFDFSQDGSDIYAAVGNRRVLKVYDYPGLTSDKEIALGGYPGFVFRKGNQLIIVGSNEPIEAYYSYYGIGPVGFEIVNLE